MQRIKRLTSSKKHAYITTLRLMNYRYWQRDFDRRMFAMIRNSDNYDCGTIAYRVKL